MAAERGKKDTRVEGRLRARLSGSNSGFLTSFPATFYIAPRRDRTAGIVLMMISRSSRSDRLAM